MGYFKDLDKYNLQIICPVAGNNITKAWAQAPQGTIQVIVKGTNYVAVLPKE